ncbi:hypothetical protein [Caudoviricetes sp.]|nr:hypothetical protein [Caudoviricetes sp.]UOF81545.1 hypothetical protein [Caudoviricetes sp.]
MANYPFRENRKRARSLRPAQLVLLGRAKFEQFISLVHRDSTANALRRVENHVRLVGVGVTKDAGANTVNNRISAAEIAKRHRIRVGRNVGHIFHLVDRITSQHRRSASLHGRLPKVTAIAVLQDARRRKRATIGDPRSASTIGSLQTVDHFIDRVEGHGRVERAGSASRIVANRAKGQISRVRRNRLRQDALRLLIAGAADESSAFLIGELKLHFVRKPLFDVHEGVIEERLRGGRGSINLHDGDFDFFERRGRSAGAAIVLTNPTRSRAVDIHETTIGSVRGLANGRNLAHRGDELNRRVDSLINLRQNGKTAIRLRTDRKSLTLQVAQIALREVAAFTLTEPLVKAFLVVEAFSRFLLTSSGMIGALQSNDLVFEFLALNVHFANRIRNALDLILANNVIEATLRFGQSRVVLLLQFLKGTVDIFDNIGDVARAAAGVFALKARRTSRCPSRVNVDAHDCVPRLSAKRIFELAQCCGQSGRICRSILVTRINIDVSTSVTEMITEKRHSFRCRRPRETLVTKGFFQLSWIKLFHGCNCCLLIGRERNE